MKDYSEGQNPLKTEEVAEVPTLPLLLKNNNNNNNKEEEKT